MKYLHVLNYVRGALWAIDRDKLDEIMAILAFRASGDAFTEDEIQDRIGARTAGNVSTGGATAVVPLRGVVAHRIGGMAESSGGMSAERFTRMMQSAAADPSISAIVIDTDSPGGTVNGVSEAADAVYQARQSKPVIAVANGLMASAAYWIASQAHEVVAVPSLIDASIGSIGVYTVHADMSAALEKEGVKPTIVSAGKYKVAGNPFEPLSAEELAVMQSRVDASYDQFVAAVARGRGVDASAVRGGFGEGRALPATAAKKAGLVDRIATMDATLARLSSPQVRGKIMSGAMASIDEEAAMMAADAIAHGAGDGTPVGIMASKEIDGAAADLARRIEY
jgi:signal peptide peptidase SppA